MEVRWEELLPALVSADNATREHADAFLSEMRAVNTPMMLHSMMMFVDATDVPEFAFVGLSYLLHLLRSDVSICSDDYTEFWNEVLKLMLELQCKSGNDTRFVAIISQIIGILAMNVKHIDFAAILLEYVTYDPELGLPVISTAISKAHLDIPIDHLIAFLTHEVSSEEAFQAKIHVLIECLSQNPGNDDLHGLFSALLQIRDYDQATCIFNSMSDHCNSMTFFIPPHFEELFEFINWHVSCDGEDRAGMFFLVQFCSCFPKSEQVITTTVQLLASHCTSYDSDENGLYQSIRTAICDISLAVDGATFVASIENAELNPLQFLTFLSSLRTHGGNDNVMLCFSSAEKMRELATMIATLGFDTDPEVRLLALDSMGLFCDELGPLFHIDNNDILIEFFGQQTSALECPPLVLMFLDSVGRYFGRLPEECVCEESMALFNCVFEMMSIPELQRNVLECLAYALIGLRRILQPMASELMSFSSGVLESGNPELILGVIQLVMAITSGLDVSDKMCVVPFWRAVMEIRGCVCTGEDMEVCDQAMRHFTKYLGMIVWEEAASAVPSLLESVVRNQIEVCEFEADSGIDVPSGFIQVVSQDPSKVTFINESSVQTLVQLLEVVKCFVSSFGSAFCAMAGEPTLAICDDLLQHPYLLSEVKSTVISIVSKMSRFQETGEVATALLLNQTANPAAESSISTRALSCTTMTIRSKGQRLCDADAAAGFGFLLQNVLAKLEETEEEDDELMNEFSRETKLMTDILELCDNPVAVLSEYVEHLFSFVSNSRTRPLAYSVLPFFIIGTGDLELVNSFTQSVIATLSEWGDYPTAAQIGVASLGTIIESLQISDSGYLNDIFSVFGAFISHKDDYENETRILFDTVVTAFSKAARQLPSVEAAVVLANALPLARADRNSDYVISTLIGMLSMPGLPVQEIVQVIALHFNTDFVSEETNAIIRDLIKC